MAASDIIIKCEEFIDSEENIEDINQTFFNDYDEHRHDSEPENNENRKMDSECENDDIKLQEILQEFDLEILFTLLKFSDITYRSLLYISENDINTAIRSIAYRAEFREKLFAWRRDKYNLNDVSVLPPPKQSSMPLGVNNSHNIPLSNTNTNRDSNSPMNTTTSTKPSSGLTAPRAKRTLSPKTSAAKKSRTTSQAASDSRVSVSSPTRTSSSEALSISQHGTKTRPSIDFDKPLCFKPTTSSAAAAATTSSMTPITDSFLSEPPTEYAEFIQAPSEVSLLGEPQPKTTIGKQLSIIDILNSTDCGKLIIKYFQENQKLSPKYRKLLTNTIINYIIRHNISASPKLFDTISDKIVSFFSTEAKEVYFISHKGKKPGGSLYCKYHNSIFKLRQDGIFKKKPRDVAEVIVPPYTFPEYDEEPDTIRNSECKDWLLHNTEPLCEVLTKWADSFYLRLEDIKKSASLWEILREWPCYKQSFGFTLVEYDFNKMFPKKEGLLFEKWDHFCEAIKPIFDQIKEPYSLGILKKFQEGEQKKEVRDIIVSNLLHAILKPAIGKRADENNHVFKPTISDSRHSFLLWSSTQLELEAKIKKLIETKYKEHQSIHPMIGAVGDSIFDDCEFYVYFADTFYKFDNLIKSIDICFKLFHVLNLKYPLDCKLVWLMIAKYFYDFDLKSDEKCGALSALLNDLYNFKA